MSLYPRAGADPGIPSSFTNSSHHLLNRHLQNKFQLSQSMKPFSPSEKYSDILFFKHPHLYLLRVHDVDRQVEGPQHHVAVAVAVVWCTLGGDRGVAVAASAFCPPSGNTRIPRTGHGGLRWGTLH